MNQRRKNVFENSWKKPCSNNRKRFTWFDQTKDMEIVFTPEFLVTHNFLRFFKKMCFSKMRIFIIIFTFLLNLPIINKKIPNDRAKLIFINHLIKENFLKFFKKSSRRKRLIVRNLWRKWKTSFYSRIFPYILPK